MSNLSISSTNRRSRFGCISCKSRHVKCDEGRPSCLNCKARNSTCAYRLTLQYKEDLQFTVNSVNERARSGKKHMTKSSVCKQKRTPKQKTICGFSNSLFINFIKSDFSTNSPFEPISYKNDEDTFRETNLDLDLLQNCVLSSCIFGDPIRNDKYFEQMSSWSYPLSYYVENISLILDPIDVRRLNISEQSHVSFHHGLDINYLLQYSNNHSHVGQLLLSLSSLCLSKFSKLSQDSKEFWASEAKKLRNLGLKSLLKTICDGQRILSLRVDLFLSFLLITLYDLANNCDNNWSNQLKICKSLLNLYRNEININDPAELSLFTYAVDFFAYQESMSRTACNKSNVFNKYFDLLSLSNNKEADAKITIIPWMGCDRRLLSLISDITDLSFERLNTSIDFVQLAKDIKLNLESLKAIQASQTFDLATTKMYLQKNEVSQSTEEFCLHLNCEVKRLTAMLYCECSLFNKYPSHPDVILLFDTIFNYLKFIIFENGFKWGSITWSLFIISSQLYLLDPESEIKKLLIWEMLEFLRNTSFGNTDRVGESINKIWKRRSLNNYEIKLQANERSGKNDWEAFVVDQKSNLSLG